MLETGMPAPGFTVPGTDGDTIEEYSLAEFTEEGGVVLTFYPFDFSPVCADQLCTFRDAEWLTVEEGIDVLGISPDSAYCHKQFIEAYDLEFPLLTDRLGSVAEDYGLLLEEFECHEAIPKRAVVAVDSDRTVRYVWTPETQYQAPSIDDLEESIAWHRQADAD